MVLHIEDNREALLTFCYAFVFTGQQSCPTVSKHTRTPWCYQWTKLALPRVYNRRHIQADLWLTFSFYRQRKYLMINFPFWQKLFPYKTKNLTHKRWKRPTNSSSLSPCQHWTSCYSTEQAFYKGQEAANPKVTVFTSSSVVFIPDFDNGTKNIILHLHKVSICCAGEQGNSISKEIKEMPQDLNKYLTVYFFFFHYAHLKKKFWYLAYRWQNSDTRRLIFSLRKRKITFFFFYPA